MRLFLSLSAILCAASAQQFGGFYGQPAGPAVRPLTQTSGFGPAPSGRAASPIQQMASWTYLNFDGIDPKRTVPENGVFTGIQVTPDRIFLTLPRSREGVPATLTWMPNTGVPVENQPLLPFPDWSWQQGHLDNCSGLVSVFRSRIDSCGRLWALDSGVLTPLDGSPVAACPPRLVAFDLKTGLAIRSVTFPPQVLRERSLLTTLSLDEEYSSISNCENMFVYISDTSAPGLIIYDLGRDLTWRFEHQSLMPDPQQATYTIAGESFNLEDGVVGMTISNLGHERMLYYHPLAGRALYAVSTNALRNPGIPSLPVIKVGDKTSQGAGLFADTHGEIYFSPLSETAIASWNPNTGLQRILAVDPERLQFISDITVDQQGSLWFVSNRFQAYFNRNYNPRGTNLRVMRIPYAANGAQFNGFNAAPLDPFSFYNNRFIRDTKNSTAVL
ncbi:protein yellow-like [Cloeon dipterum]|uniref:protein yellow-like n=1 Tax=Cloeon dipterum TaxID=197152 RepID=UPI0032203893